MAYRVLVWGLGAMGSGIAKNVVGKEELRLVGAVERNAQMFDKDVGIAIGDREYGCKVYSDIELAIEETEPDIAVIATNSFVKEILPKN